MKHAALPTTFMHTNDSSTTGTLALFNFTTSLPQAYTHTAGEVLTITFRSFNHYHSNSSDRPLIPAKIDQGWNFTMAVIELQIVPVSSMVQERRLARRGVVVDLATDLTDLATYEDNVVERRGVVIGLEADFKDLVSDVDTGGPGEVERRNVAADSDEVEEPNDEAAANETESLHAAITNTNDESQDEVASEQADTGIAATTKPEIKHSTQRPIKQALEAKVAVGRRRRGRAVVT